MNGQRWQPMRNNLTRRLVDLEANWVDTTGARKLDLGWLTKEERGRLRTILLRVKDHPSTEARMNALTTAERAWLPQLGNRGPLNSDQCVFRFGTPESAGFPTCVEPK